MLSFSNTNSQGTSQTVAAGSLFTNASGYGFSIFSPTARSLITAGASNTTVEEADRTSTTCFMRGYKEKIRIQTSSSLPWLWRRIVFTTKGDLFHKLSKDEYAPTQTYNGYSDTSIGMARLWFDLSKNASPLTISGIQSVLFKGTQNQDWNDLMVAPVDGSRVTILSDKVSKITTGNSNGHFSERNLYYSFNKNIVYDDDESGGGVTTQYWSTNAKPGMGDVYIIDITVPGMGGSASDVMNINAHSTLYWHEK